MTVATEQPRSPHVKKWTKEEYLDLVDRGVFRDQRVYLFRGDIIEMAPQGHPHAFALMRLFWYLAKLVPEEQYEVRMQCPFVTPGKSVPEPDVAVCTRADAARKPHPSIAALIIEIAYSSLEDDRALADEYAAARVPEYWIMDVDNRRIEVFRQPVEDAAKPLGYRYAEARTLTVGDEIAPAVAPLAATPVGVFFT